MEGEYRTNFRQIDRDAIRLLNSPEARRVTHLMASLYLALIDAPTEYWEREGVLRFAGGGGRQGAPLTAWRQLVALLGCGNTTAKKALDWMHERGLVGYFAGKNGAGIRVFINRAASSIGRRGGQKNLRLVGAPERGAHVPEAGVPSNDSFAVLEVVETDLSPAAPKDGAEPKQVVETSPPEQRRAAAVAVPVEKVVEQLKDELEPCVREAAARAAAQMTAREMERTREWFETKALPKAVRVAQRETYDLLRKHGGVDASQKGPGGGSDVGRAAGGCPAPAARALTPEEVRETAEVCVALLETQGKSIEATLFDLGSESGGWLLPEDVPRVREAASKLAQAWGTEGRALPTPRRAGGPTP